MISRILMSLLTMLVATSMYAQVNTYYVRAGGDDNNDGMTPGTAKATIQGVANLPLQYGDVIDIGAGDFAGAALPPVDLTILGVNAYTPWDQWGNDATVITSAFVLNAGGAYAFEGLTFAPYIWPLQYDAYWGYPYSIALSNCLFDRTQQLYIYGSTITTIASNRFVGDDEYNGGSGVYVSDNYGSVVIGENTFDGCNTGVVIYGSIEHAIVSYNDFRRCYTGIHSNIWNSTDGVEIRNNIFAGGDDVNLNGVTISASGNQPFHVTENSFGRSTTGYALAIANWSSTLVPATCNYFGTADAGLIVGANYGNLELGPYNAVGTDIDDGAVGFVPDPAEACATEAPIKTSTDYSRSFFSIQAAIDASTDGAVVRAQKGTFPGGITVGKSLTIIGSHSPFTKDGAGNWVWTYDASDARTKSADASAWTVIDGAINVTAGAGDVTLNAVSIKSDIFNKPLNVSATRSMSLSNSRIDAMTCGTGVPTQSAITLNRAASLNVHQSVIDVQKWDPGCDNQRIRALTCAIGNLSRSISITNSNIEGSLEFRGLSSTSVVTVSGNKISNAGADGVTLVGNTIRTYTIENNEITDANNHGIAFRNAGSYGTALKVNNNLVHGSGAGSANQAGIFFSAAATGTINSIGNNSLVSANAIGLLNDGTKTIPVSCQWWGSTSGNVVTTKVSGNATVENWLVDGADNSTATGFQPKDGVCTGTFVKLNLVAKVDIKCNGAATGSIDMNLVGGTAPYTHAWTGPNGYTGNTLDIASLKAGTYNLRSTDKNGTYAEFSVTLTEPTLLVVESATVTSNFNGSQLSCNGALDGQISMTAMGGVPPYKYSRDNGVTWQDASVFTGLGAATYAMRAKDANDCVTPATNVTITAPPALQITSAPKKSYNGSDLSCNGATDGEITVNATGGTGTKEYSKDNGATYQASNVFGSLAAGTYQMRVRDVNACTTSVTTVTITAPPVLSITSATKKSYNGSDLSCNGATDGEITVSATGGTGTLQYSKDNGSTYQASNVFGTLAAGTYQIRVKDANNCVTSATSVTITAPPVLSITGTSKKSYNGADLSCNGAADGEITVTATGGTGNKQYSKDNGSTYQASNVFGTLAAGTYQIRVRDDNGCTTLATSVTITAPPALAITNTVKKTYNGSELSCNGAADGEITVTATGGTGTKQYSKDNGSTYQASNVFGSLAAGTYQIRVKDANNCVTLATSVTITAPPALAITSATKKSYNGSDLSCNGAADGEITVTATGGTGTKQYSKDNGSTYQASNVFGTLAAGTYQIRVKDANNCVTSATSVTITAPPALSITSATKKSYNGSDLSCNGATDGQITVSATGGTGTLQYSKDNGSTYQASNVFGSLAAGTYQIRVKDANNCVTSATSVTITAPPAVAITKTVLRRHLKYPGDQAWQVAIGYPNDLGAYDNGRTYQRNDQVTYLGETYVMVDFIGAGGYTPTGNPAQWYKLSDLPTISCNGANDGGIRITATGGTGSLQYSINGTSWQPTNTFENLAPGTYTVYAKDANGCTTNLGGITITQPAVLAATITSQTNVLCNGNSTGSVTVTATAGTGTRIYRYSKDGTNFSGTNVFGGLAAGSYTITVKDANNCTTTVPVTITQPAVLSITSATKKSYNGSDLSCNGATDGEITVAATGGNGAYQYSKDNGSTYQASNVFGTLASGTYQIRVKDANNCVTSATSVTITAPPALSVTSATKKSYNGADLSCNGAADGEITVTATGGTGTKQYSKDNGSTYQASNVFGTLAAGTYQIRVKDVNNCVTSATSVTITAPPALAITSAVKKSYNGSDLSCPQTPDGQITVTATGGTGNKEYSKDNGSTYQASNVFMGLGAGTYQIRVKDANNCVTSATSVTITAPPALTITGATKKTYNGSDLSCNGAADGEITVTATGGTGTKQYSKDNGSTYQASNIFSNLAAGTYQIFVKDANNCTTTTSVTITAPPALTVQSAVKKSYNGSDVSCAGATDGQITVTPAGGTGTVQYSKDNGVSYQASNIFAGLAPATYDIRVKDANGCVSPSVSVTIKATQALSATASKKSYNGADVSCATSADGEITVTAGGGTGTLEFSKDGGNTYQASNVFSNLAPGTYAIRVRDVNECAITTNVTLVAPPALTASIASISPKKTGESLTFTSTVGGGTGAYTYKWTTTAAAFSNPGDVAEWTIASGVEDNTGTYTLSVKDANGCEVTTTVDVIVYGTTVWVNGASGSDDNRGNAALPLKTIQKGIDVTNSGNTINVAGGVYSESPTLTSARTIQGTNSPELGSNSYFIYSTGDSVTINGFASATFNTMGAGSVDGIYKALNKLNANGTLRVLSGSYTISSTINIYSGVTVKGADVDMSGTCLLDPASAIVGSGTGLVLFKFHGSAAKTVSDIKLQIGNATGRIFEIVSGSEGNVSTERVLFANESGDALYGLMNLDRSGGVVNDVAKLVNDKKDFGYGLGEVLYGNYAPLPASAVVAGWKGEDANTATQGANVSTLSAYVGTNLVNVSVLTSKPKFYSGDADILNGRAHLRFDGSDFLDASTSAAVNGGDEKTVFVAFRTGAATAEDMVVYKHGDEDQGVSVIVDSDENIELNIYEDGEVETLSYAAAANTEYIAQIYFNGTSANADATDPRVGLAIDKVDGQAAEAKIVGGTTGFDKTTLTTPAIGTASKISLGGRVGSVYIDGAEVIGTTRGNYFNGNIGEVIVLNTSAKATRDAVYCYLRNKYFDGDNQGYDNDLERRENVIAGEEVTDASLLSAFPNPADAEFTIEAYVPTAGDVSVTLHDAIGRNVMTVFEGTVGSKATLPLTASVRDLPTGAYSLHMTGPNGLHMVTPIIVRH